MAAEDGSSVDPLGDPLTSQWPLARSPSAHMRLDHAAEQLVCNSKVALLTSEDGLVELRVEPDEQCTYALGDVTAFCSSDSIVVVAWWNEEKSTGSVACGESVAALQVCYTTGSRVEACAVCDGNDDSMSGVNFVWCSEDEVALSCLGSYDFAAMPKGGAHSCCVSSGGNVVAVGCWTHVVIFESSFTGQYQGFTRKRTSKDVLHSTFNIPCSHLALAVEPSGLIGLFVSDGARVGVYECRSWKQNRLLWEDEQEEPAHVPPMEADLGVLNACALKAKHNLGEEQPVLAFDCSMAWSLPYSGRAVVTSSYFCFRSRMCTVWWHLSDVTAIRAGPVTVCLVVVTGKGKEEKIKVEVKNTPPDQIKRFLMMANSCTTATLVPKKLFELSRGHVQSVASSTVRDCNAFVFTKEDCVYALTPSGAMLGMARRPFCDREGTTVLCAANGPTLTFVYNYKEGDGASVVFSSSSANACHAKYERYFARSMDVTCVEVCNTLTGMRQSVDTGGFVKGVAICETRVAVVSGDRTVLYALEGNRRIFALQFIRELPKCECRLLLVTPLGNLVLVQKRSIEIVSEFGEPVSTWKFPSAESDVKFVKVMTAGKCGTRIAIAVGRHAYIGEIGVDDPTLLATHTDNICYLSISPSGEVVGMADVNRALKVYRIDGEGGIQDTLRSSSGVASIEFHRTEEGLYAYGGGDHLVLVRRNLPPCEMNEDGYVMGFEGSQLLVLRRGNAVTVEIPEEYRPAREWSPYSHFDFPFHVRFEVVVILSLLRRPESPLCTIPFDVLQAVFSFLEVS